MNAAAAPLVAMLLATVLWLSFSVLARCQR